MAKKSKRFKSGSKWEHIPSGGIYEVLYFGDSKIPHVGWFKAITYKNKNGRVFTRFIEDFENKFRKVGTEIKTQGRDTHN